MAAVAILDFQKFEILTVDPVPTANMRHRSKFHQDQSVADKWCFNVFFKMVAIHHLVFVGRLLGPHMKTT